MKNINIILMGLMLLGSFLLIAQEEGKKPVDEGQKSNPKEDKIKGSEKKDNKYQFKKVSLSKIIKDIYIVKREYLSHSPFTCLHYNGKTKKLTTLAKESNTAHSFYFKVKKSILKVGDEIIIVNDVDAKKKNMPLGKKIIIEIEIIK